MTDKLYKHQLEALDWLMDGGSLLADGMGVGKSRPAGKALLNLNQRHGGLPGIIVCPSVVCGVWGRELEAVGFSGSGQIVTSPKDAEKNADVYIVSVDLVARNADVRTALMQREYGVLLLDEAHYTKNGDAQRTARILLDNDALATCARELRLLTGTPCSNHVGELWPLLAATAPGRINGMGKDEFEATYCTHKMITIGSRGHTTKMRVVSGNRPYMVPILRKKLKGWWMRRTLLQVAKNIPPKARATIPLPPRRLRALEEFLLTPEGQRLAKGIESGHLTRADEDDGESLARLRRLMAMAKQPLVVDYLTTLLEGGEDKIVNWWLHTDPLYETYAALRDKGYRVFAISGATTSAERTKIIAEFQECPGQAVFMGQIKAAGVGTTLTAARRGVFAEWLTNPGDNAQAEDRIWRLTQSRPVQNDYLAVSGSVDEAYLRIAMTRQASFDQLAYIGD